MIDAAKWQGGLEIRLRDDPGSVGVCTGATRQRGETLMVQVFIPGIGKTFQPDYALEIIERVEKDPYVLIQEGKYARASDLRRCLTHIQLSGKLANMVYSMETTNADFYAYQYKPVLSFIDSPSNGILIADEVGLGKTIEAGLIWTELRARLDARRLMVLCPAVLREKWQDELSKRFGLEGRIINLDEAYHFLSGSVYNWPDRTAMIMSMQTLRSISNCFTDDISEQQNMQDIRYKLARLILDRSGAEPLLDMLIVDEAHYMRNPESLTAKLGYRLREVCASMALLSATPINLRSEDLFYLLRLIDPENFYDSKVFPSILEANAPLLKARSAALNKTKGQSEIKELLNIAYNHDLLKNNKQLEVLLSTDLEKEFLGEPSGRVLLANQLEKINLLSKAVTRTRKAEVTEWRVIRDPKVCSVPMSEHEEEFYKLVTDEIRNYATKNGISSGFLLAMPQRQLSSSMYAAAKAWSLGRFDDIDLISEDIGSYADLEEKLPSADECVSTIGALIAENVLPKINIKELKDHDSKYNELKNILKNFLHDNPTEKIIIFTYFRATIDYIVSRLQSEGIKCMPLKGGMRESKQEVIDRFESDKSIEVLVSTEVACEGVDLQFCRVLFNYDLPWNPMRVEQRIGRIDRLGQKANKISIINLVYANTIDERILSRLYERLDIFRKSLGDLEAILGEKIEQLTSDLLSKMLSPQQEKSRIDQTAFAIERIRKEQEDLEGQASNLIAHGGYILEQVHAARQFTRRIREEDLFVFVKDYLEVYATGHVLKEVNKDEHEYVIRLPSETILKFNEYIQKRRLIGGELVGGGEVRCRFINKVPSGRTPYEQISQFHPIIRFITNDLSEQSENRHILFAVKLRKDKIPTQYESGIYAFWVSKCYFEGLKTEEDLKARVCNVSFGNMLSPDESLELIHLGRLYGENWLSIRTDVTNDEKFKSSIQRCDSQVDLDYQKYREMKENENYDRVNFQKNTVMRFRERKMGELNSRLEALKARDRVGLIPAMEGQIRKLKEKTDLKIQELTKKEKLSSHLHEVAMGFIQIV